MQLSQNGTLDSAHRRMTAESFAVLPVAADWDARFWSVRRALQLDTQAIAAGEAVSLFMIRMDTGGSISVRVSDIPYPEVTVKLEWNGNSYAKKEYQIINSTTWVSHVG